MKRAQRRAHLIIWLILLPLTLLALILAYEARRETPVVPLEEGLGVRSQSMPLSADPLGFA